MWGLRRLNAIPASTARLVMGSRLVGSDLRARHRLWTGYTEVIRLARIANHPDKQQRRLLVVGYHALIFICLYDNVCS